MNCPIQIPTSRSLLLRRKEGWFTPPLSRLPILELPHCPQRVSLAPYSRIDRRHEGLYDLYQV